MELEQVIPSINATLLSSHHRCLTELEIELLRGAWESLTYDEISAASGYSLNYLQRDIGPKFWKLLSDTYGRKLNKTNARAILTRFAQEAKTPPNQPLQDLLSSFSPPNPPKADWGEIIDVSTFYGRTDELDTLTGWIRGDRCRLVALVGMGGIGKSSLAAKITQILQDEFDLIIWRSLRNAPPLELLLAELVPFLSQQQDTQAKPERLLHWLRTHRCLLILDNVETIMQAGDRAGYYQPDYENYGDLFRLLGETSHQSCVLLTTREIPAEVGMLETLDGPVRLLPLKGSAEMALALLESRALIGTEDEKRQLCEFYNCSPLAVKLISSSIQSLFDGSISAFWREEVKVFNGIRRLLEQQFERLSYLEQAVMYWLAINREWVSLDELMEDLVPPVSRASLLESLESLSWRSLIEKNQGRYTQQPVVMEYVTSQFIHQVSTELVTCRLNFFARFALAKNSIRDYIHESQVRIILQPVLNHLQTAFSQPDLLRDQFCKILKQVRQGCCYPNCYSAGNLLNLMGQYDLDLTGYDFSGLTLRHAHLQKRNLHKVNFTQAQFIDPVFTHTLTSIFAVAFSPDGTLLATGESTGEIHIWRTGETQPLLALTGHANRILSVSFSPDGCWLASASADSTIKLWDLDSGAIAATLTGHTNGVCSVRFSADQSLLASASLDGTIRLWDVQTAQLLRVLDGHTDWVWGVCFSPIAGPPLLASGSADATVKLWDAASGQLLQTLEGHGDRIWSVQFSPDGRLLASTSEDCTIKLWDVATGQLLRTLAGHSSIIWSASFSADGRLLASGSSDQTVRLWDVETGQLMRVLTGHTNRVWSVRFSPSVEHLPFDSQSLLASGSADCTMKLWDAASGQLLKTIQGYTNGVRSLDFSDDGQTLASGTIADDAVRLWHVPTGTLLKTLTGHTDSIHTVRCYTAPDGQERVISAGSDHTIRLWNAQTGQLMKTLHGHTDTIWSISVAPQLNWCASAGADNTIRLWDLESGRLLHTLTETKGWVWAVTFSPDGRQIATGSANCLVKLWDVASGKLLKALEGHTAWVRSVKFSPDGLQIASGSADCTVKVWCAQTGELKMTLAGHDSWTWEVSFSPDCRTLVSSSTDGTLKLWDTQTGTLLNTLKGHTGEVWSARFSPDGSLLASSSADETVRLWDAKTGECVQVLRSDRPYEGMNITGVMGLTEPQKAALIALGAVENGSV
ncbi:NB-ARC domain-containing protein [Leptolyngbya sp. O-77]|uniref:WD40 domain-containing protein n=1 Tax=Leptolyngbya sp. O-77 TaxID=1080068 RepID=UPI00074D49A6|nr:NB-ARC domain-containing protein [Leptolyngbya sp. O-77]BAU41661.1 translocation protein TolB [Leptolyngbya sp. O-77]